MSERIWVDCKKGKKKKNEEKIREIGKKAMRDIGNR